MNYPLIAEYIEAIKTAGDNLNELVNLHPVLNENGEPVFSSGNFAVVFKMEDEQTGKLYALKCFLKEKEGREEAYHLIEKELQDVSSTFLTPIRYIENELFVDTYASDETEFPVLLMDWVEGVTLEKFIYDNIENKEEIRLLSLQFRRLAFWLITQPFAHGDLKPDNILVQNDGTLVLVDYDGMYVPAMKGQKARELGSPDFRHPQRDEKDFDEHIDDFPLAVLSLSLQIIQMSKSIYNELGINNGAIFHESDFINLSESKVNLSVLSQLANSSKLTNAYSLFLMTLSKRPMTKQILESVLDTTVEETNCEIQCLKAKNICNEGEACENDLKKAFIIFKELYDKQYDDGAICYSCCLRNGYGCEKNINKGLNILETLANKGVSRAQLTMGICYKNGFFVSQDYQKAVEWFTKSAEQGDPRAQNNLGYCYLKGRGVQQDFKRATEWYFKAAEQDYSESQFSLGLCYSKGLGVTRNIQKAVEWFAKSAEQGYSSAQFHLGQCYEDGQGVLQDYQKAVEWFTKAAEQGDAKAQRRIGYYYSIGRGVLQDYQKAIEWFIKAAEQGDAKAQLNLGICYEYGRGVMQDYQKAIEWYIKAAVQGDEQAQNNLGVCYVHGRGVIQDYQKAIEWFTKSAEQCYPNAERNLGLMYAQGQGVNQDYQKAVEWFTKAAEQGYSLAQLNLGNCYARGQGIIKDYQKAMEWFFKSAEQGNPIAQRNLGVFFEKGMGVSQDYQKAIEWYTKSAEQGDDISKQALERLNNTNDNFANIIHGTYTDPRDGYTYKTIKIGNKTWLAENLRYLPKIQDGFCVYGYKGYNLIEAQRMKNYLDFGALYDMSAARKACPPGWHIPSDEEWQELREYLGASDKDDVRKINIGDSVVDTTFKGDYGTKIIGEVSLWKNGVLVNNIGKSIGFSALPGGWRTYHSQYTEKGEVSRWWSSTSDSAKRSAGYTDSNMYYYYTLYFDDKGIGRESCASSCCLSVRCIKDN